MPDRAGTPGRPRRRWRIVSVCALVAVTAALLAGCTTSDGPAAGQPLPGAFADGVPAPSAPVVLTITTDDAVAEWDLPTIGLLEQQQLTIVEPFVQREHTYTGPRWAHVLQASGVDLDAGRTVELVALDDYMAEIATDAATLAGVLLAHLEDGEPIPIADGGPIRLVYPPDNPAADNANNWIWSIRTARIQ